MNKPSPASLENQDLRSHTNHAKYPGSAAFLLIPMRTKKRVNSTEIWNLNVGLAYISGRSDFSQNFDKWSPDLLPPSRNFTKGEYPLRNQGWDAVYQGVIFVCKWKLDRTLSASVWNFYLLMDYCR